MTSPARGRIPSLQSPTEIIWTLSSHLEVILQSAISDPCTAGTRGGRVVGMAKRLPLAGDEKATLRASLDRHRDAVLWKLEDLDDEQLRRPVKARV